MNVARFEQKPDWHNSAPRQPDGQASKKAKKALDMPILGLLTAPNAVLRLFLNEIAF